MIDLTKLALFIIEDFKLPTFAFVARRVEFFDEGIFADTERFFSGTTLLSTGEGPLFLTEELCLKRIACN